MKKRSSQPNGVENGLNMSQLVPNIKVNHQKYILELYRKDIRIDILEPLGKKEIPMFVKYVVLRSRSPLFYCKTRDFYEFMEERGALETVINQTNDSFPIDNLVF